MPGPPAGVAMRADEEQANAGGERGPEQRLRTVLAQADQPEKAEEIEADLQHLRGTHEIFMRGFDHAVEESRDQVTGQDHEQDPLAVCARRRCWPVHDVPRRVADAVSSSRGGGLRFKASGPIPATAACSR